MKFDDLDNKMRIYETAHDFSVLPEVYMVARLDGRGFSRLTKDFKKPFDSTFRDCMQETIQHLMTCGFRIIYVYTQSDEVSLLFDANENGFNRKLRKYQSVLSGEASAKFSLILNRQACFDCRISQLPNIELVIDYFRWRNEDAYRNALTAYCYWALREGGNSPRKATASLDKLTMKEKIEILTQYGKNFDEIPQWEKRGIGYYWENFEKEAVNLKTGEKVKAIRKRIKADLQLPIGEEYSKFRGDNLQ